ncbi:MAG: osmotically inducible protein OsmC [Bacteroidetes bacterium]|nr:MAG: osmotically inducible protein OsmC [Bacteroidota bacterium]
MKTKTALVKQVRGITLAGKSDSAHWVMMDGSETFGGSNAGSSPKELLLMALGGCTAMDVIPILTKKKTPFDNLEINLTATMREEQPQVFTDIQVEYVVYGEGINPEDVERAIELSTTKYCAVSAMLRPTVNITHTYRIEKRSRSIQEKQLVTTN